MFNILIASPRKQKHKGHFVEVCCLSEVFHTCLLQSFRWDLKNVLNYFKSFLLLSSKVRDLNTSTYCTSNSPWSSLICAILANYKSNQISWTKKEQLLSNTVFLRDGWQNLHRYKIMSSSTFTCYNKSGRYTNSHCVLWTLILKLCVNRGSESRKDRPLRMSAASLFTRSYISNKHTNTHSDMR